MRVSCLFMSLIVPMKTIEWKPCPSWNFYNGMSPSGKAVDSDSTIRGFKSFHPSQYKKDNEQIAFCPFFIPKFLGNPALRSEADHDRYAPVAQLDRAMASDAMCRWFESSRAYQNRKHLTQVGCFFVNINIGAGNFPVILKQGVGPSI